jgi:hypothetical protein
MLQAGFAKDRPCGSHRPYAHRARGRELFGAIRHDETHGDAVTRVSVGCCTGGRMARGPADRYASRCYRACEAGRTALLHEHRTMTVTLRSPRDQRDGALRFTAPPMTLAARGNGALCATDAASPVPSAPVQSF